MYGKIKKKKKKKKKKKTKRLRAVKTGDTEVMGRSNYAFSSVTPLLSACSGKTSSSDDPFVAHHH
jgi:hypothetical protein